jgi:hypothetical protein
MSHIFISYSRKDIDFSQRIVAEVEWRLESARAVPFGDDIEFAVETGLKRAGRLRHIIPEGEAVPRSAFEGRSGNE